MLEHSQFDFMSSVLRFGMQSCSIVAGAQLQSAVFGGEFWFAEEHQGFERAELGSVLCLRICRERVGV
jgi:hypothetical protein